jgi:hypothetical protein
MSIHAPRGAVPPFNGGGVRGGVAQLVKDLLNAALRTMSVADVHGYHALAFSMFHDLDMRQRARDTVAQVGEAPPIPLTTGTVGLSENLWEQAGIADFAIGKQDQAVTIGKPLRCILQQASDECFIAPPLDM